MASLIKVGVINLLAVAVHQAKDAVLFGVALMRVDLVRELGKVVRVVRVAKELKVRIVIKARKCTMDSLLLSLPVPKVLEMDLNGVPQKGANPSIKDLESLVIQAKASDFDEFSSKSAIILVLQQFAVVLGCYRLMLRST